MAKANAHVKFKIHLKGSAIDHQTISFRPQKDLRGDFVELLEWCEKNDCTMSQILNSFLPAISYAVQNCLYVDDTNGWRYVRADFSDVLIREYRNIIGTGGKG